MDVSTLKPRYLIILFLIITTITLTFGLLPRGDFDANWIENDQSNKVTWIGEYGYAIGQLPELTKQPSNNIITRFNLTLTMREQVGPTFRILIYIGEDCESEPLIIGQWRTHLIVMQGCDFPNVSRRNRLSTDVAPYLGSKTTISILLGQSNNELLINDELVSTKSGAVYETPYAIKPTIIVGNSPDGRHGWSGSISSLSIEHVSETIEISDIIRDYQFGEYDGAGTIIDLSAAGNSLSVPRAGSFQKQIVLARTSIKSLIKTHRFDVLINLIGFMPMGIVSALLLYACFGFRGRALFVTTVLAASAVSLSIELSQVYIAGRRSNLHDLVLNIAGGCMGYIVFCGIVAIETWRTKRGSLPE